MASNLRVDTILPSTGTNVAIGTASGSVTFIGDTDITTNGSITVGGNLGIGGTLTYEDVTNIDSVGVITARAGLDVSGAPGTFSGGVHIDDSIVHLGDTNTKIRFPGADQVSIETAGSQRLLTRADGRIQITSGNFEVIGGEGGNAEIRITADEGDDGADYWRFQSNASNNNLNIATYASGAWVDKVSVNSSGTLLVGATSYGGGGNAPALYVSSTSGRQVKIHNTNANTTSIQLTNATSGEGEDGGMMFATLGGSADGWINNAENAAIRFGTNGNERMRILAGGGLTFNGDTTAANALNDYEEGSFTPRFQTSNGNWGGSMSSQNGSYTKIGNVVHVTFRLHWGSVSGSGNFRITALPFTVKNVSSNQGGPVIGVRSGFNYPRVTSYWMNNAQQLQFQFVDASAPFGSHNLSVGAIASSGYVYCSGWYETA